MPHELLAGVFVVDRDEYAAYRNEDRGAERLHSRDILELLKRLQPYLQELDLPMPEPPRRQVHQFDDQACAVMESGASVFSFVFGIPHPDILALARKRGVLTAGAATTLDEALVLRDAVVDLIVASGMEAGGHRPSFLHRAEDSLTGTMALTATITAHVRLLVIAAGGIADARGMAAVQRLGASAAQLGTAFLACEESGAPEIHRNLLFTPAARQTCLTRIFSGRLARGICNRLVRELATAPLLPYPAQGWVVGLLRDAAIARKRPDLISLWAGQSAALLRWRRAEHLIGALVADLV